MAEALERRGVPGLELPACLKAKDRLDLPESEQAESEKTAGRMFCILPAVFCHPYREAEGLRSTKRDVSGHGRQRLPQKNDIAGLMLLYNIVLSLLY